MIIIFVNQLRNRHNRITLRFQPVDQLIQRLGRILRTVMAEDDAPVSEIFMLRHRFKNRVHTLIFPVKGIDIPLYGIVFAIL